MFPQCRGGPQTIRRQRPPPPKHWYDDPFLTGASMLLRLEAVNAVGPIDEDYFLYFEDADYVQVLRAGGWKTAYVPDAAIIHDMSSTTGFQSEQYVYYFSRNRLIFLSRWVNPFCFWYYLCFTTLVKLPGAIIVFGLVRRKWPIARAFFSGYWAGLRRVATHNRGEDNGWARWESERDHSSPEGESRNA